MSTIAGLFGLTYDEKNPGLIDHDMRTALIAPDERVIHMWNLIPSLHALNSVPVGTE